MAFTQASPSISFSLHTPGARTLARTINPNLWLHNQIIGGIRSTFVSGSPLLPMKVRINGGGRNRVASLSVKCEQSIEGGNSLDVSLGRGAMIGFAIAITVEIATGKGLLENFGVISPLPTVVLAVTALVGILSAVFIFQSAAKN